MQAEQSFTRKQLYDLVWKEPVQTLAPKFGLSDRGLGKLCERYAIPTPPRGYWARKQAGQKVVKAPLIELEGSRIKDTYEIARYAPAKVNIQPTDATPDPLLTFWQEQREAEGKIPVAKTLANAHPVVAAWADQNARRHDVHARWGGRGFDVLRITALDRRRFRILSALYKALEARGITISCERGERDVSLRLEQDHVSFDLREHLKQKRRPLTPDEEHRAYGRAYRIDQFETGFLRGRIDAYLPREIPTAWTETAEKPFEDMLGEVVATILTALAKARALRLQREEAERLRLEAQRAAWQRQEQEKAERLRESGLRARATAWRQSQDLRAYIDAVRTASERGSLPIEPETLQAWITWALRHADALDPLAAGDALETHARP